MKHCGIQCVGTSENIDSRNDTKVMMAEMMTDEAG